MKNETTAAKKNAATVGGVALNIPKIKKMIAGISASKIGTSQAPYFNI
jgi:hypothetical protein